MREQSESPTSRPAANEACWCGSGRKYKRCHREDDEQALHGGVARASAAITPAPLGPPRTVPAHIPRPDYAETGRPGKIVAGDPSDPDRMRRMRRACTAAANILRKAGEFIKPGITADDIDVLVHEECIKAGGYPSPLNYRGFPKSVCTSVNEVICHGIPDTRVLQEGDIVNVDVTIYLEGMHGDTNATFPVGRIDDGSQRLIAVTHECLMRGIAAVRPGGQVRDIGRAIESKARAHGFSIVRSYCGHGIGEMFHSKLQIPHYYEPRSVTVFQPGMTFTIEPMINEGSWRDQLWDDGWTVVTADGKRSAQFEHTILVTEEGVEILTEPG